MTDTLSLPGDWTRVSMALAVVTVVAYVAAMFAGRLARAALLSVTRLEAPPSPSRDGTPGSGVPGDGNPAAQAHHPHAPVAHARSTLQPVRIVRGGVFIAVMLALSLPALELAGIQNTVGISSGTVASWLFRSGVRILVVAILTYALVRIIAATARRLEQEMAQVTAPDMLERLKRARTLSRLLQNALTVLVVGIAGLMVLHELRVDIMPILTGAGIVGLAVGFGAQTLVKDLIAGFFLTMENQVRVGDVAVINGAGGLVEEINLRTIVLRDSEGAVHVFPNGSIERLSNRSKDYSYAVIDIGVAYAEDPDRIMQTLRDIGRELLTDPFVGGHILEPVEVQGIESFEEARMVVRSRVRTVPLKQWDVAREFRRRIIKTFDERGIVMPTRPVTMTADGRSAPVR
jgi:small-conductance mechanosensitive channel